MGTARRHLAFLAAPGGNQFSDSYDRVVPTFRAMVAALLESEPVNLNVCNGAHEAEARAALEDLPPKSLPFT